MTRIEMEKAKLMIRARALVNVEVEELRLARRNGFVADVAEAFDAALQRGETLPTLDLDSALHARKALDR
jgi:hypothetical protein